MEIVGTDRRENIFSYPLAKLATMGTVFPNLPTVGLKRWRANEYQSSEVSKRIVY